jgi:hypothetical protein
MCDNRAKTRSASRKDTALAVSEQTAAKRRTAPPEAGVQPEGRNDPTPGEPQKLSSPSKPTQSLNRHIPKQLHAKINPRKAPINYSQLAKLVSELKTKAPHIAKAFPFVFNTLQIITCFQDFTAEVQT